MPDSILWFNQIHRTDTPLVGGKGANLGEMYNLGVPVPNGFVVTVSAYRQFIDHHHLDQQISQIIATVNLTDPAELQEVSLRIKKLIKSKAIPEDLAIAIMKAYKKLCSYGGLQNVPVAVRSSATAEDSADASFAGQQETFLNVLGEANVIHRVRDCWASLFTPRSIFYRHQKKISHLTVAVAVPVQKMVESDISGICFTQNPVSGDKTQIIIETVWGLGEYIVQGIVTPDQTIVSKDTWKIVSHQTVKQTVEFRRFKDSNKSFSTPASRQLKRKISESLAIKIAKVAQKLHNHYGCGQDIEFAIKGNELFIVQTRPITTIANPTSTPTTLPPPDLTGQGASPGFVSGVAILVAQPKNINLVKKGQILVTSMTSPDFVPAMKIAGGIITDKGGQTSHAAIVSRELGVPCVVGTESATKSIKTGDIVTLNGSTGQVWFKDLKSNIQNPGSKIQDLGSKLKTATKVYVNLGEPDLASEIAKRNVDGIGLLRAEFIMANIGIHPKKIIADGKQKAYIKELSDNIAKFCKSFNPRPVIYRATDFKTNEYRYLKWGKLYEPVEPNPMLGFRGASRYLATPDVFQMELEALKTVRNKLNLKNLWLMIPFVRTVHQLIEVKKIITTAGLIRSPSFKIFLMVEIPSNVILLKDFASAGIDGISIGSNDLTMLTLGLDRDNSEVAADFNELDPAVLWMLRRAVKTAKKLGITSSICGQAPSNHPDLVEKLVKWGITSISVSPDAIDRTRTIVSWAEKRRIK
ncbi:MAG: phosphoenolpyruvate synthase [Candidatus Shapirobacteria bacterium]|jgi:pyruvate,water dikinase